MKENVVEIKGHKYRYIYEDGETRYLGPVGSAPQISEAEFLLMMKRPESPPNTSKLKRRGAPNTTHQKIRGSLKKAGFDMDELIIKDYTFGPGSKMIVRVETLGTAMKEEPSEAGARPTKKLWHIERDYQWETINRIADHLEGQGYTVTEPKESKREVGGEFVIHVWQEPPLK